MRIRLIVAMLLLVLRASAQGFFNLTAEEVKIDSVLPLFTYSQELGPHYADSVYRVSIDYPEFIEMSPADIARYQRITSEPLPSLPEVETVVSESRRQGKLHACMVPLVFRDGKYQKLVSFKLTVHAEAVAAARRAGDSRAENRYADHSVLATGTWAKIRVTASGIHHLSDALVRQAGFSNPARVKIYGYGGALQPEVLTGDYLTSTDDLKEVPTCTVNGRRLFYAVGPVSWNSKTSSQRTRNPYSDYGYYFLTENDDEPQTVDSETFLNACYPSVHDYHTLVEQDGFAWLRSGRNLYHNETITTTGTTYQLTAHETKGQLVVVVAVNANSEIAILLNGEEIGKINYSTSWSQYTKGGQQIKTIQVNNLNVGDNSVTLKLIVGEKAHLDYIALTQTTPADAPNLDSDDFPVPSYVHRILNQDHHADTAVDMVIVIPTSQKFLAQAERLKTLHEECDGLRVRIVPADELYNEFSSGTPDANAYRRYLKMLYDRAETEADMPRYLLLFGSGVWDNRMLTSDTRSLSVDDYLLCYESENSFSETDSYVSDDYFGLLDDGEGANITLKDTPDVGIGRLPAATEAQAKILVDKIYSYCKNEYAGDWQNVLCFIGDDGNNNVHMEESNAAAEVVETNYSGYDVKRVFFDAYDRTTTTTGNSYPDVERLVKQQMRYGALMMNYCGHGAPYSISHEKVLLLTDFSTQTSLRLPLWVTASCDIMPFDAHEDNIGETAMLNAHGGAIAFYGTTRTVYVGANKDMNCTFVKYVLGSTDGRRNTLGDAVRLTKGEVFNKLHPYNKLHYSLLGDPALALALPTHQIVIDSINGKAANGDVIGLGAGSVVTVKGHVVDQPAFDGVVTLTVKDVEDKVICKLNNISASDGATDAYEFKDRPNTLYNGSDSIRGGAFTVSFSVPRDVSYSEDNCQILGYAVNNDRTIMAHGENDRFAINTSSDMPNDGIGPSIYCYLNNSSFVNGGKVNTTPYFYAELTDKEGINASGSGIGHDLELVVDGDPLLTFNLNTVFQYDFGDYHSGSVGYSLPELTEGEHQLSFRAWDVLNNPSVAELKFNVVRGLKPHQYSVACTKNPARTSTSFIINHDRTGSEMDVELEIFDASGRILYRHTETGVSTDNTYTLDWDLMLESGSRMQTGVYLYRVLISSDGSKKASQAQKLIILRN